MTNENDSILVFEYFTASGEKDKCIISEAEALIFALLDDLADIQKDVILNKSYENIIGNFENANPIDARAIFDSRQKYLILPTKIL